MPGYDDIIEEMKRSQAATGSAPAPYDDAVQQLKSQQQNTQGRAAMAVGYSVEINPDRAAQNKTLAKRYNTAPTVVEQYPEEFRQRALMEDARAAMANAPRLTEHIAANPANAQIIHDDVGNAAAIERSLSEKILWSPWKAIQATAAALPAASGSVYGLMAVPFELASQYVGQPLVRGRILPEDILGKVGGKFRELSSLSAQYATRVADVAPDAGNVERGFASGFQSVGQNMPVLVAALLSGNVPAAVGAMAAMTGGASYTKGREAGLSPSGAAIYGASDAAIEYITEIMPATKLIGEMKAGAPFIKAFMHNQVGEQLGEQAATVLQDFNEWATLHPEKPFADYIAARPDAAIQTAIATVIGSGGQVALLAALKKNAESYQAQATAGEQEFRQLTTVGQLSTLSKWRTRDPEGFKSFVENVTEDGHLENVYIEGRAFAQALEKAGVSAEEVKSLMPEVERQMIEAEETDGYLRIAMSDYATHIAGGKLDEALLPHLKTDPNGKTYAEAQDYYQKQADQMAELAMKVTEDKAEVEAFKKSQQTVQKTIAEQLDAVGRFAPEKNKIDATIMTAMLSRIAVEEKITPEQALEKYGAQFVGDTQQGTGSFRQGYGKVPDALMGFRRNGPQKGWDEQNYKHIQYVRVTFPDGQTFVDAQKGLNGPHAMERARRNWETATIEALTPEEAALADPGIVDDVATTKSNANAFEQAASTRVPFAKGKPEMEDAVSNRLQIGLETFKTAPKTFDAAVKLLTKYVNWRPNPKLRGAESRAEKFISDAVDNLLWLYDQVPAETRARSKLWYVGAHRLAEEFAAKHPVSVAQASAVIAVNSPQTEWFTNISRADRILDIWFSKQDQSWTPEMEKTAARILAKTQYAEDRFAITGKTLAELNGDAWLQAVWMRVYDESHNPKKFREVKPEGALGDFVKNNNGNDAAFAWASFGPIAKAIEIIKDGSPSNISRQLGGAHKVRSFYNNIYAPNDPHGDVTIDTHAVAAALLRPLAGSNLEVEHNLGAGVSHAMTGIQGTYGIFAEAYRRAAEARGVLPREMQSITWEAVRGLYTDVFKSSKGADEIEKVWAEYKAGKLDETQVRAKILEIAGGINEPNWHRSDSAPPTQTWTSSYGGELAGFQLPGQQTEPNPSGADAGSGASGGLGQAGRDAGKLAQGDTAPRGFYSPDFRTLGLLKDANLSTFNHEVGHWVLDVYTRIATTPEGSARIKADLDVILRHIGVEGATAEERLATWSAMSLEEQRPYHEKQARSFEAYFWEGRAPSAELSGAFSRLRAWMVSVYQSLRELGVELTPEVRSTYDRMLASDAAIEEAQAARVFEPLFKTKPEGMTDAEWAAYQSLGQESTDDAIADMQAKSARDMRWLSGAKDRALRALQKTAAAQRREVRIDARREILSMPIYQAWQFLTRRDEEAYAGMPKEKKSASVDPARDSIFEAISKLGGVNRDALTAEWGVELKDITNPVFGKPVARKSGGMSLDRMAESLAELGYLPLDENGKHDLHDFEDAFTDELAGAKRYSTAADYETLQGPQEMTPEEVREYPAGKLDRAMLGRYKVELGEAVLAKLEGLHMVQNDRLDPELVADRFGFESAEGFLTALAEAANPAEAIEALTDRYMLERHGELSSPAAIARAADDAIHNDARARFVATALKVLAKSPIPVRQLVKGAREAAEAAVAAKKVRDLDPRQYEAAEARANKAALRMVAKDPAGAMQAQRASLLNNQLVKATRTAIEDVQKAVAYFKRLERKPAQGNMRGEYLAQLNALLARFDLRTSVTDPDSDIKPLSEWLQLESERLSAVMPDLPAWVLNDQYRTHYSQLTVEQLRGLRDSVRQLEHMARREEKQYQAIRQMEFAAEREGVLAVIRKVWAKAFDENGDPHEIKPDFVPSIKKAIGKLGDKFAGEFLNPETIISILGGGRFSLVNESLFGRLSARSDWKAGRLEDLYKELKPFFNAYSLKEKFDFGRRDIATPAGLDTALTRENALVVALLHGNAEGRERLANYGWSEAYQQQIISLLDARDLKLADAIWRMFDENLWPELRDLNDRTRGKSPPKVEALPYTARLRTAGGVLGDEVSLRGGYFRLKYDTTLDERAHRLDEGQAVKDLLGGGMGMSSKTNQGSSTERKQGVKLRPRLDLSVFSEAVNETVHDLAYREAVADTMRMLNDKGIMLAIKNVVGLEGYRALITRVREVAAPPRNPAGFVENTISIARRNTIINLMSGVKTALQNFTGLAPAFAELNAGTLGAEIAKFYSTQMLERYEFAMAQSAYMRRRFTSYDRDLQSMAAKLTVKGRLMPDESTWFSLMGFIDKGVAVPIWNAAYRQGMEKFENDTAQAVTYADHIVRATQGSGRDVDLAAIMSGHGGWGQLKRAFTMFYSYFNGQLGLLVKHGVISKLEARNNPQLATAQFAAKVLVIVALPTILTELLMHGWDQDGEDEEERRRRFAGAFIKYGAGFFPFVRDIVPAIWAQFNPDNRYFGVKISPLDSAYEGIVKGVASMRDVVNGEADEKDTKNLIMATGYLLGLPGKLVSDTVEGTRQWLSGEAGPQAVILGPPPKR